MPFNHVVVWLDHTEAHIIHFNRDTAEFTVIKTGEVTPRLHIKSGIPGSGRTAENSAYLNDIAGSVKDAQEILIVGPGLEKMSFIKHLQKQHRDTADKVVGVETVDHPSNGQLLAYAKKYFYKVDMMR